MRRRLHAMALILGLFALNPHPLWIAPAEAASRQHRPHMDRSGRAQKGLASYYARRFRGHRTADGGRLNLDADVAASRNLPLGTTARVTNLENGRSTIIRVTDRGPFARGRILDVTPKVAQKLGMRGHGVVRVRVAPIAVPQVDGGFLAGDGVVGSGRGAAPTRLVAEAAAIP